MSDEKKAGNPLWRPGVSGNPSGTRKTKPLTDHLKIILASNPERARSIADKLIAMAEEGNLEAVKIVLDRVDGKPVQQLEIEQTIRNASPEEVDSRIRELATRLQIGISRSENIEDAEVVNDKRKH